VISGSVAAGRGPIVLLVLRDSSGNTHSTSALVDTGFNASLTLPRTMIVALGLPWQEDGDGILANGSTTVLKVFKATIIWDGQPKAVLVHELESEPLIGMRLLHGFRFIMDSVDGGLVQIERI
jgi:clan AA aspartic protease